MDQAQDLRINLGTWAVATERVPAVAAYMVDSLPCEEYDPAFIGQQLVTTYFDTPDLTLRKSRRLGEKYLVLRLRSYENLNGCTYAVSAKTENEKFRTVIEDSVADDIHLHTYEVFRKVLPTNLLARLMEVPNYDLLQPIISIDCTRYAVEDDQQRYTFDTGVRTTLDKVLTYSVLEFKSTKNESPPEFTRGIQLNPIKLSKFLWATER